MINIKQEIFNSKDDLQLFGYGIELAMDYLKATEDLPKDIQEKIFAGFLWSVNKSLKT